MPAFGPLFFFDWKVPFKSDYWMMNPRDFSRHDQWVTQRSYPAEIRETGMKIAAMNLQVAELGISRK